MEVEGEDLSVLSSLRSEKNQCQSKEQSEEENNRRVSRGRELWTHGPNMLDQVSRIEDSKYPIEQQPDDSI